MNYHWNSGRGAKPGTISLQGRNGRVFGPWQTHGASGQGGAPDAYWICEPGIRLEAGDYVVIDSDWETWAQNPQSGGRGLTRVEGYPAR